MSNVFKRAWPQLMLLLAALAGVFMLTYAQQPHTTQAPAVLTSGVIGTGVSSPHPCGTQYATKRGYLTHHIPYFKGMLTSNTCGYVFRVKLEWTKADHQTVLGRHHSRWVTHRQIWRQVNGGTGTYLGKGWVQWATCASGCQIGSYRVFNLERPPVVTAYQVPQRRERHESFCAQKGHGSCLKEKQPFLNSQVVMQPFANIRLQDITFPPANVCNGGHKVTSTCPFAKGSGLNTKFKGHTIQFANWLDGGCLGLAADGSHGQVSNCTGKKAIGVVWVRSGFTEVNVRATNVNLNHHIQYLDSPGTNGDRVFVGAYDDGRSQWAAVFPG